MNFLQHHGASLQSPMPAKKQPNIGPETGGDHSSSGLSGAAAIVRSSSVRRLEFYYI
jgi:hypothetical protein